MNKFFVSSDWHLDAVTAGVKRRGEVLEAVRSICSRARNEGAGFIFAGDLCDPDALDSHRHTAAVIQLASNLRSNNVPSLWIAGNHDIVEDGCQTTTLEPLAASGATVVLNPERVDFAGFDIGLLPYTAKTHPYDPAIQVKQWIEMGAGIPDVVIGHLDCGLLQPGSETDTMARGRRLEWPLHELATLMPGVTLIGGHYHRGQQKGPLHIIGAPARFNFGEADHVPSYLSVELKIGRGKQKRTVAVERHTIPNARRVYSIGTDTDEPLKHVQAGDIIRILAGTNSAGQDLGDPSLASNRDLESALLQAGAVAVRFKTLQHGERAVTDLIDRPDLDAPVSAEDGFAAARRLAQEWPAADAEFNTQLGALVIELEQQSR